jgi:phosphoglycerate dehydrogenase-like enzyme/predicted dehydrogenase
VSPTSFSTRPIRALVIGAGPTTVFAHLPVLARMRDHGELTLAVVCDIDGERAARARSRFGFLEESTDARAMLLRPDIDAVYLFGSAQLHYEYGMIALRNAKHLFVEKPIAPSYAQALQLARLAQARGLIAVGGLNRRFFKSLAKARQSAGESGWRSAEVVFHKPEFGRSPSFGARTWLGANGIHALDAMLYMMGGLPSHLTSLASTGGASQPAIFSAVMHWGDGAQGTFLCNNNAGMRREEYVFHALGETCTIGDAGLTVTRNNVSNRFELPLIGDGFEAEHEAFIHAIRDGSEPRHALAAIAPSLFIAELIEQGFSGAVRLPAAVPGPQMPPPACIAAGRSMLVAPCAELLPVLNRCLSDYALLGIEEVRRSPTTRGDVVAAVLGRGCGPLPRDVLDKLPNLSVVGVMALSLARHQPDELLSRGITLLNASDAYAQSVAEFALGLAILGRRRAFASHDVMREGGWGIQPRTPGVRGAIKRSALALRPALKAIGLESMLLRAWRASKPVMDANAPPTSAARDLQGASVGLIGWGANGRAFAERLIHAGARVLVHSQHAAAEQISAVGAIPASLGEVLAAEIVSLHRGLTASTRHGLGAAELARLRPGSVLINVARGALIEPSALLKRLRRGDIFACLDTYDEEPLAASHPLRRLRNVFLTSHIAGGSGDMHAAAAEEVVSKVAAFLAGERRDAVTAERLRTMT